LIASERNERGKNVRKELNGRRRRRRRKRGLDKFNTESQRKKG